MWGSNPRPWVIKSPMRLPTELTGLGAAVPASVMKLANPRSDLAHFLLRVS